MFATSKVSRVQNEEQEEMITKTEYDKRKTKRLPYISQSVEDDGWIEQLTDITKLLIKFLPTILGLFDETTDILYLFLTDFAYATLKYIFIICLLFSPILQMLVWTFFFASHQLNRYLKKNVLYNTLNKKYMELYINKYYSNRSYYASYIFYILASIVYVCIFLFLSLLNLGKGFLYALGSELKILPFYLSYHYQNELKYEITEDLVQQFKYKEYQINLQEQVIEINERINQINKQIDDYNSKQEYQAKKRVKRVPVAPVFLSQTDFQARAKILKDYNKIKKILCNSFLDRFLQIGDLIEAVFESLPMLAIQYINNVENKQEWTFLQISSFALSAFMVTFSSYKMINKLAEQQAYPLIGLIEQVKMRKQYNDPGWLLGVNKKDNIEIQNHQELELLAYTSKRFYKDIEKISLNLAGDEDFIAKALCGKRKLFLLLRQIFLKCQNPQMELVLNFNDNNQIEGSHIILFSEGIKYSSFKSIDIRMRKMKLEESKFLVENRSYETLIENLNFEVQSLNLVFYNWLINDVDKFGKYLGLYTQLRNLQLNFGRNHISDINTIGQSIGSLKALDTLNLNFGGTSLNSIEALGQGMQQIKRLTKITLNFSFTEIDNCNELFGAIRNQNNLVYLKLDLSYTRIKTLDQLHLGLKRKNLTDLNLNLKKSSLQQSDGFFKFLKHIGKQEWKSLKLNFEEISGIDENFRKIFYSKQEIPSEPPRKDQPKQKKNGKK